MQIVSTLPSIEFSTPEVSNEISGGLNTASEQFSLTEDANDTADFSIFGPSEFSEHTQPADFATHSLVDETPIQPHGSKKVLRFSSSSEEFGRHENVSLQTTATTPNTADAPMQGIGKETRPKAFSFVSKIDEAVRLPNPNLRPTVVAPSKNEGVAISSFVSDLPRQVGRDSTDGSSSNLLKTVAQNKDVFPIESGARQSASNIVDVTSKIRALPEVLSKRQQTAPTDQSNRSLLSVNRSPTQKEQEIGKVAIRSALTPQQPSVSGAAQFAVTSSFTSNEDPANLQDAHVPQPTRSESARYQNSLSVPGLQTQTLPRNAAVNSEFPSGKTTELKGQLVFGYLESTGPTDDGGVPVLEGPQMTSRVRVPTPIATKLNASGVTIEPNAIFKQISASIPASNKASIEVKLWPEELGRVRLTMTASEAGMNVQVAAERPEVLELMRRHIGQFEQELLDQGFANLAFSFGKESSEPQDDNSEWIGETPVELIKNRDSHRTLISAGHVDIRL